MLTDNKLLRVSMDNKAFYLLCRRTINGIPMYEGIERAKRCIIEICRNRKICSLLTTEHRCGDQS